MGHSSGSGQRRSSLKNSNADLGGDSSKGLPAPSDGEDALPDDSSLSYIGMTLVLKCVIWTNAF